MKSATTTEEPGMIVTAMQRTIEVVPERRHNWGGFAVKVDGKHRSWFHHHQGAADDANFLSFKDYCRGGMIPGSTRVF